MIFTGYGRSHTSRQAATARLHSTRSRQFTTVGASAYRYLRQGKSQRHTERDDRRQLAVLAHVVSGYSRSKSVSIRAAKIGSTSPSTRILTTLPPTASASDTAEIPWPVYRIGTTSMGTFITDDFGNRFCERTA
jgi:hypothetical protein